MSEPGNHRESGPSRQLPSLLSWGSSTDKQHPFPHHDDCIGAASCAETDRFRWFQFATCFHVDVLQSDSVLWIVYLCQVTVSHQDPLPTHRLPWRFPVTVSPEDFIPSLASSLCPDDEILHTGV